jgi:hypothetical protein
MRPRDEPAGRLVTTAKEQFVLGERLQAVEDDLFAAGKRHVFIRGVEGSFEWWAVGADREPIEQSNADDVREIEDMLVTEGHAQFAIDTAQGHFTWRRKS